MSTPQHSGRIFWSRHDYPPERLTLWTLGMSETGDTREVEYVRVDVNQEVVAVLRGLAQMPLRASGKDYDPLVKAARDLLPEYSDSPAALNFALREQGDS